MKRDDLNQDQLQIVEANEPLLVVTGGPGSGKTATALFAGREALLNGDLGADQYVLYLTFSRSAVTQIVRRAPRVMDEVQGRIEVHTFHGLAFRLVTAFGRYAGMGLLPPQIQSEAARKLVGKRPGMLVYDQLVPQVLQLLEKPLVRDLVRRRWPLVICDEFQDTGDDQWELLKRLHDTARLILLADPEQMIHDFRNDVSPARLEQATALASRVIKLPEVSFRDPSGTIPGVAHAVMRRDFADPAIPFARDQDRLRIIPRVGLKELPEMVANEIARFRGAGCKVIGVYSFTNEETARLSGQLAKLGVNNAIIGIPESHGEGMATIGVLLSHAAGSADLKEAQLAMATFVTAYTRKGPTVLARQLAGQFPLPGPLLQMLQAFSGALKDAADGTIGDVLQVIRPFWAKVFATGERLWLRAFASVIGITDDLAHLPVTEATVASVVERIELGRSAGLVSEFDDARLSRVQLMNLHQTKGREADGVIIIVRDGDIFGEAAPYPQKSRLLFVAITRARQMVTVMLPPNPHDLVAPLLD